ncbi:MAG: hypothetical protein ACOX0S_03310 [Paludibacteraceae bacterium]
MKTIFKSATIFAGILMFSLASCERYDMIDNVVRVGQMAPTIYWELPSNSVAAGENVEFHAQYYTREEGVTDTPLGTVVPNQRKHRYFCVLPTGKFNT